MKNTLTKKLSILFAFLLLSSSPANLHIRASTPNLPIIPIGTGAEDDDFPSPRDRIMRGRTESSSSSWANWFYEIADYVTQTVRNSIFNSVYPVGTIYMTVTEVNPHELFGGTWIPWGRGRVPVGVNNSIADFSTIERTGGEIAHTLTYSELPTTTYVDSQVSTFVSVGSTGTWWINNRGGGNQPHNNLQPYITCYMWKKVA